ncbi:MAG: PrsW family intramembrane metalloprotease [Chloroflexota bacterium]|nr:MAG: PrsW family intramembrane metalloprotease [Chloroflexota bacterium]
MAAVIPTLFFVSLVYWVDRYEKEPLWLLSATFLWGAIPSIMAALLLNALLTAPPTLYGPHIGQMVGVTLIAPVVEESLKGLAVLGILLLWRHEIDSLLDGIIYGAMVGFGFAMVENVFYFMSTYAESGQHAWEMSVLLRGIVFGLNHALYSSMIGLGVAVSRLSDRPAVKVSAPIIGWLAAVTVHLIHNLSASLGGLAVFVTLSNAWGGVLVVLIIIAWALLQERRWIRHYLAEEVQFGTMTAEQYRNAFSSWRALAHRYHLLATEGYGAYSRATHFYRSCSELAYQKHHQDTSEPGQMDSMREKISTLSRRIN